MNYKVNVNRPLVMGIQEVVGTDIDGFYGRKTEEAVKEYQLSNNLSVTGEVDQETLNPMLPEMSRKYRILEVIACFEVGWCRNAWNKVTTVQGDGAGESIGPMQHNRYGSLQTMRKRYKFTDPVTFYGSIEGALSQLAYFEEMILQPSEAFALNILKDDGERTLLMCCDASVQNGSCWPTKRPYLFNDWPYDVELIPQIQDLYRQFPVREAFERALNLIPSQTRMYIQLHPRSGNKLFLNDQIDRRTTAYMGTGQVHGESFNLRNFGF